MKFQKQLKKFLLEIGKVEPKYKKLYKKSKSILPFNFIVAVDENTDLFLTKDPKWFSIAHPNALPIDCSPLLNGTNKSVMWKHAYSLYICAVRDYKPELVMFLTTNEKKIIKNETDKRYSEIAQKVYDILIEETPDAFNGMMPENLGNLAVGIAKDLKGLRSLVQNMDLSSINNIDPENPSFQNIFKQVSSQIQNKIENKEIDPELMAKEAEEFLKKMNLMPMMENLKKNNK